MAAPPVVFDHVWKKFRSGERHDSLRDLLPAMARSVFRARPPADELQRQEFWALEDVAFEVAPGEALGIIGPNGAGKSTILKLLTRILRPNVGRSTVTGRVGALIEIAAGFHPDLTGRENVYLQGAIMGMKRAEVAKKFDAIVDFAGVGQFIDTQIKRYSSGMNARLGFAIAAHLDPDVLIIDEVLSVGDMAFQQQCVSRMTDFKRQGVTIVFVSHNLQAVSGLCDRALYLKRKPMALGRTSEVIDRYVREAFSGMDESQGSDFRIRSAELRDADGGLVSTAVMPGARLEVRVEFEADVPFESMVFAFRVLRSTDRLLVYDGQFPQEELRLDLSKARRFSIVFEMAANLTRGQYYVEMVVGHTPSQRYLARLAPIAHIVVDEDRTWGGVADLAVRPLARTLEEREDIAEVTVPGEHPEVYRGTGR
jgi:homopolymeric O-antigen transport system ATP-binding protein